jgi:AraC family transcriptional regulator, regulatory protein of adaptative response / DNA-3-methyladenine glycosylase II
MIESRRRCALSLSKGALRQLRAEVRPLPPARHRYVGFPLVMSLVECNCRYVHEDFDRCYRALQSKDARFDGWFVTAVLTTKIYCRPSCPARSPYARNVRFYPTAAAAQRGGFRACKRCRPDASPGSPEWNTRGDVVARAMRLIADGEVDRIGVTGLAARLGYTPRQLERLLQAEVGAGPLALARAQRAQTARILIETTELPFGDLHSPLGLPASASSMTPCERSLRPLQPACVGGRQAARVGTARLRRGHCRCACRCERHSRTRVCSVTWRPPRYPVAKRYVTAHTGVRCGSRPAMES